MNRTISILSIPFLAVAVFSAGCGKAEEKPVAAKTAADAAAVDISTLPAFLRYPGAQAIERMQLNTSDSKGTSWLLVSNDPRARIEEWYRASVEKAGWVKDPDGNKVGMLEWEKPDKTETIKMLVYEKDGKTNISLTHGLR